MGLSQENKVKVSIGLPVYNGEKFIRKRIESILSQTFKEFELIISDNASEDQTEKICIELANTDDRIHFFRQNKNKGPSFNFQFVLIKSNGPYFVWAAVDDEWDKDFLKETINFLEKNNEYVGSIGQVERYGEENNRDISNRKISSLVNFLRFSKYGPHEAIGTYNEKIRIYLKASSAQSLYGVFRTDVIKKSFILSLFLAADLAMILNLLKFGNFHVINKNLIKFYAGGKSSGGIIESTRKLGHSFFGRLFPYYPFTSWCWSNLGKRVFFKNLDLLIKINFSGFLALVYDLIIRAKS